MSYAVRVESDGLVSSLTLNRPDKGNALSAAMVEDIFTALNAAENSGSRILIFRGNGKHFCTGFDLSNLDEETDATLLHRFVRIELMLQAVAYGPFETVAAAQGRCMGAGADLFAACKTRIAAPDSKFAFPGSRFGLNLGRSRLAALVGTERMMEYVDGQITTTAEEAFSDGLVSRLATEGSAESGTEAPDALEFPDTRDLDLANLVRSAARPGLKSRIRTYIDSLKAKPS